MVNYRNFTIYKPEFKDSEEEDAGYRPDILYARDETGRDWYDCQADFSDETLKVMYDDKGVIVCMSKDVTAIFPPGFSVAEVAISEVPPEACNDMTWAYCDGKVAKRVYSQTEKRKMVQDEKKRLIARVNQATQTLNSKLLLGMATDEEKAKLRVWMDYVNEIEKISDDEDPGSIVWPTPAEV
uniref:tail fiber assembly protein n=1 Tax=Serratia proteamaculans TaxID=28151 RepID=UPI001F4C0B9F|nr:tail fiber assembly protein [Serratia proteamaculans]ULG15490.1 tail fiber assembly protein [Serratia proteamaculans]